MTTCTFCERPLLANGMCSLHYQRWRRTGDPTKTQQGMRSDVKPIEERMPFFALPNGCHEWTAGTNQYGYGKVKYEGRTLGAHRVAWYLSKGEWPVEELDHLCHTLDKTCVGGVDCRHRRCINPAHLEEVSKVENTKRRDSRR